jgi:hypothetical protein
MPIVLQPIDQTAKKELAQQLACWARAANGMTDVAVQFGTCCVSPTGETLGRWTIPNDLCTTYGEFPFTGNNGETIVCPPTGSAEYVSYYIYDSDVDPIDVDTCVPLVPLDAPTDLTAGTPTDTTIPLTWTASANADGYTVAYSSDGGVTWLEVQATASPFTLTGLTPETEYTIRIRATDSTNTFAKSAWTATVTATTESSLPELAVPANLATGTMTDTTAPPWTTTSSTRRRPRRRGWTGRQTRSAPRPQSPASPPALRTTSGCVRTPTTSRSRTRTTRLR